MAFGYSSVDKVRHLQTNCALQGIFRCIESENMNVNKYLDHVPFLQSEEFSLSMSHFLQLQ